MLYNNFDYTIELGNKVRQEKYEDQKSLWTDGILIEDFKYLGDDILIPS